MLLAFRLSMPFAAALLAGCTSVPQGVGHALRDLDDGRVEHIDSGMRFPPTVAGLQRIAVRPYDAEGRNISAGYNSTAPETPIAATVYVYPSLPIRDLEAARGAGTNAREVIVRAEFNSLLAEIRRLNPDTKLVAETTVPKPGATSGEAGLFACLNYTGNIGGQRIPIETLVYLYVDAVERWTVKYRFTYPSLSLESRVAAGRFLQQLEWTFRSDFGQPHR